MFAKLGSALPAWVLIVLVAELCLGATAMAAAANEPTPKHTPAGTPINTTAVATWTSGGQSHSLSASGGFFVDQLLDVAATWQNATPVEAPAGSSDKSLLFKITNIGNGNDSYALTLAVTPNPDNGFTATDCVVYLDSNHDGVYSQGDQPYPAPESAPTVSAGAELDVLAVCNIPVNAPNDSLSNVQLSVVSNTLSGDPGESKPRPGHPGQFLVVGLTGNTAAATGSFLAINAAYSLTSSQVVTDASGGHMPTSGSNIAYTVVVTPSGTATGRNLKLVLPIPDHTTYVSGSLKLNGMPLGDSADDGDAGEFDPATNTLFVHLGDVPGSADPDQVVFQVTIN